MHWEHENELGENKKAAALMGYVRFFFKKMHIYSGSFTVGLALGVRAKSCI